MSKEHKFELIALRYRMARQVLSVVSQAWFQVSCSLPVSLNAEKRSVGAALAALQDALFESERDEVRAAMDAAMEADE